jgi:high-affinity iron transporter
LHKTICGCSALQQEIPLIASLLLTFREGLEAALIIGIILSVLRQVNRRDQERSVWVGIGAAIVTSVGTGLLLNALGLAFEGGMEEIFEGFAMLVAAAVLTWMIFWMQRQAPNLRPSLEQNVQSALDSSGRWALFGLTFVSVLREGIETALFMTATVYSTTPSQALLGGFLGLVVAVFLGYLIFMGGRQMNMKMFFRTTSLILLVVAAGLVAHGIHELQEAALVPIVIEHVWNINPILDENGSIGIFLRALFGYNGNPSLVEVIVYVAYLLQAGVLSWQALLKVEKNVRPTIEQTSAAQ